MIGVEAANKTTAGSVFHQLLLTMRRCHRFGTKNKDEMCISVHVSRTECNAGRHWGILSCALH